MMKISITIYPTTMNAIKIIGLIISLNFTGMWAETVETLITVTET